MGSELTYTPPAPAGPLASCSTCGATVEEIELTTTPITAGRLPERRPGLVATVLRPCGHQGEFTLHS